MVEYLYIILTLQNDPSQIFKNKIYFKFFISCCIIFVSHFNLITYYQYVYLSLDDFDLLSSSFWLIFLIYKSRKVLWWKGNSTVYIQMKYIHKKINISFVFLLRSYSINTNVRPFVRPYVFLSVRQVKGKKRDFLSHWLK